MIGEILFLAHRMPFPPNRGDKIRSHHVLKHLARLAPVHVATFADDAADLAEEAALSEVAASYCLRQRTKPLLLAGAQSLLQRRPVSLTAFYNREIAEYVERMLAERPIAAIYVFSGQMGQYVPASFKGRVIADLVDVDSAKFDAYGEDHGGVRGLIEAREGRLLRAEEARLAERADICLLISRPEADLFEQRLDPILRSSARIAVLPNGIDADSFAPGQIVSAPELSEAGTPRLIFSGQMDYAPNIAAVQRVAARILPMVRQSLPDATFHVVGRNPPDALRRIERVPGCKVWGGVPDIRTWLAGADVALVPLMLARGVQNKVLEAMAMERPVVLTNAAATGIAATDDLHFAIADDDAAIAAKVVELLSSPSRAAAMGQAARRFVVETMSWNAALAPLSDWISDSGQKVARHAA